MSARWLRASKRQPCPVCQHTRRCHIRDDRKAGRCYWPAEGDPPHVQESGEDDNGEYVVWFTDAPAAPGATPKEKTKRAEPVKANPADFQPVYRRLLDLCPLTEAHQTHLDSARGIDQARARQLRFASLPGRDGQRAIVATLEREFGRDHLLRVPGFKLGKHGIHLVAEGSGILIPYRLDGEVAALELRLDDPGEGGRYRWISGGGISIETVRYLAEPEIPIGGDAVLLTEGAFKALAGASHYGISAIGVPGISNVYKAFDTLRQLAPKTVLFAPDADHANANPEKAEVFRATVKGLRKLWEEGYTVKLLRWVPGLHSNQPKGLDDALAAGLPVAELDHAQIEAHLANLANHFGSEDTILAPPEMRKKPQIIVNDRDPEHVDAELLHYLTEDGQFYSRGIKVACLAKCEDGLRIDIQNHETMAFRIPKVVKLVNKREAKEVTHFSPVRPSKHLTGAALVGGAEAFPPLYKILDIPFFDKEGRLVQKRGYDKGSHIYYEPSMTIRVNVNPTRSEIASKLQYLNQEFFREFAFAGESDRCHGLCALLQPFLVELINARSPAYLFRANQPDSGKTFLAQCIGIIAFGGVPEVSEEEAATRAKGTEMRKLLDTHLIDGAQGVLIDNIESDLNYPWLFQYLTSRWLEPRILGKSEKAKIPNRILWMITANTPNLKQDAVRRLVPIKFDLGDLEGGHERTFERDDLGSWIVEHRKELIEACLTIVAGWVAAGCPRSKTAKLNSYNEWSTTMGGLMEFLGVPGFLATTKTHRAEVDEAARRRREIIDEVVARHGLVRNVDTNFIYRAIEAAELIPPEIDLNGSDKKQIQQFARYLKRIADNTPRVGPYRVLRTRNSITNCFSYSVEKIEQTSLNGPEGRADLPEGLGDQGSLNDVFAGPRRIVSTKIPEGSPKNGSVGQPSGDPPATRDRINTGIPEGPEGLSILLRERERVYGLRENTHVESDIAKPSGPSGEPESRKPNTWLTDPRVMDRIKQLETSIKVQRMTGRNPAKLVAELAGLREKFGLTDPPAPALAPPVSPPPPTTAPQPPRRSRLDDPDEDDVLDAIDSFEL